MIAFKHRHFRALDWLIAGGLGLLSLIFYIGSLADYAFPGTSAHLIAVWRGLDMSTTVQFPLMGAFAQLFGGGNALAPVCGTLTVMIVFLLVKFFVHERIRSEKLLPQSHGIARIAGIVSAVVFMLTPAVRSAATHLEPRMFDTMWALLTVALLVPYAMLPSLAAAIIPALMGVMVALGLCDGPLVLAMLPFYIGGIVVVRLKRGVRPYLAVTLFVAVAFIAFLLALRVFGADFSDTLKNLSSELKAYRTLRGWLFVAIFATLPFVTSLFSSNKAYNETPGLMQWMFHALMTVVSILAFATPLSPSVQMQAHGVLPVLTSGFVAVVAGYLVSYWWCFRQLIVARAAGGVLVLVLVVSCVWNVFDFDGDAGAFADRLAKKVLADLGERKWIITDGLLDDHLRIAAADAGKELYIIAMSRDLDSDYLEELGRLIREKRVGGDQCESLALSLSLGVLPFVQDWFAGDPDVAKNVVVFGAPDLWYSGGLKPVPEFVFFGGDEKRPSDWSAWKEFDQILKVPKGWGSYRQKRDDEPVFRLRQTLRRHLGLVANDRGVWLQDQGRDDEAFGLYELVLNEIDADNVSALFNEVEMASKKYPKALAKKRELERKVKAIIDNKQRRYQLWWIGRYYGYIRNPDLFVRSGYTWARSGRPGDALAQLRRAIDFVQGDRKNVLMNMMAALYASETDHKKSRQLYEAQLKMNADDHDALIGLMRLELLDGNSEKALAYLEKASKSSPAETRTARLEIAMVAMMKGDLPKARETFKKLTDANAGDMQAWSLLAAVTMQSYDATKDAKVKAALQKELEGTILPSMEKQARGPFDYYVQATKAFLLMRQGEKKRREARDAFAAAAKARPDSGVAQDMVLGLDISLNDKDHAEQQAREMLRRNRKVPLANYVMGSLALGRGSYREAEAFLRKAADASKPVPMAMNDLAEVLRRNNNLVEAERYARKAVKAAPKMYVAWETLGSVLLDANRNLDEAERAVEKACELSKAENGRASDVRMFITLARVQLARDDKVHARATLRRVQQRLGELSDFEKREYEEVRKRVK